MYYTKDESYNQLWAGFMEQRRLLLNDRTYARMHREYWCLGEGVDMTADDRRDYLALKARMKRELDEYTVHEKFDPVQARKIRAEYRKKLKEALKKGNWLSRLEK
ncbi:hypothetical protein ACQKLP_07905 [Chitinophaga sp. NPDC101104]|uniref:hypothetical protein n=1 Tax=Chitinophaga sp. NPDC101104 TaxID=3390561 RepID=UPI003D0813DA